MNRVQKLPLFFLFAFFYTTCLPINTTDLEQSLAIQPNIAQHLQAEDAYQYFSVLLDVFSAQADFLIENIQQIQQTISNRKLYKNRQQNILMTLQASHMIINQIRNKANNDATKQGITELAYCLYFLSVYILEEMKHNFYRTNQKTFIQNVAAKLEDISTQDLIDEFPHLPELSKQTAQQVVAIHTKSASLGLTWYNKAYRYFEGTWIARKTPGYTKRLFYMVVLPYFLYKAALSTGQIASDIIDHAHKYRNFKAYKNAKQASKKSTPAKDTHVSKKRQRVDSEAAEEKESAGCASTPSQKKPNNTWLTSWWKTPPNQDTGNSPDTPETQPLSYIQKSLQAEISAKETLGHVTAKAVNTGDSCWKTTVEKYGKLLISASLIHPSLREPLLVKPCSAILKEYAAFYKDIQQRLSRGKNWFVSKMRGSTAKKTQHGENFQEVEFVDFDDLIDPPHGAREIINDYVEYLQNIQRAELSNTAPSQKNILLTGPPQTGKTHFFKAFVSRVRELIKGVQAIQLTNEILEGNNYNLTLIFDYFKSQATPASPVIVFIDEIDMLGGGTNRDKNPKITQELLTSLQGAGTDNHKPIIVIAATNRGEKLDRALKKDGRFGREVIFTLPTLEGRYKFLQKNLQKRFLDISEENIMCIAKQTVGCTFNELNTIITEGVRLAKRKTRGVTMEDFFYALDIYVRHIEKNSHIGTQDHLATATYRAGQAVAHHALGMYNNIAKITTYPVQQNKVTKDSLVSIENNNTESEDVEFSTDPYYYGKIFLFNDDDDNYQKSKTYIQQEIMMLLAGKVGQIILHGDYYPEICKHDEKEIIKLASQLLSPSKQQLPHKLKLKYIEEIIETLEKQVHEILEKNSTFLQATQKQLDEKYEIDFIEWTELCKAHSTLQA